MDEPRVLVGTLHTAENEFECSRSVLQSQSHTAWRQVVISGLPNREAHAALYRAFMESREDADLFVKLDADMILNGPDALAKAVGYVRSRDGLDHVEFAVHDWFTDSLIMGFHVYTNRATWDLDLGELFVDRPPAIPGRREVVWGQPAPLVIHAPDPSDTQSISFGIHRAMKVLQPGLPEFLVGEALLQWRILERVRVHYDRSNDRRLALALCAAGRVLSGQFRPDLEGYKDQAERFSRLADSELSRCVGSFYSGAVARHLRLVASIGPGRLARAAVTYVRRKLKRA